MRKKSKAVLRTVLAKFDETGGSISSGSTLDQTTANQERELREVADRMGCEMVQVYKDHGISGAKGRDKRPRSTGFAETRRSANSTS